MPVAEKVTQENPLIYTGKKQPAPGQPDTTGRPLLPYLPGPGLREAVNLAIYLNRPLLLRGEPGCGKSTLARAVAFELGLPVYAWHVRSTSRAADGLYTYDAIARLRAVQLATAQPKNQDAQEAIKIDNYIQFGALGHAFKEKGRSVVLIDEIDKADIDFPNDLLDVLEDRSFEVAETRERIRADPGPIIFITSNDEKELPDAFLRRCLFAFVVFPEKEALLAILRAHFPEAPHDVGELAVKRFLQLRERQNQNSVGLPKKVSTSELLDWFRALLHQPANGIDLLKDGNAFPFQSTLIKRKEDADAVKEKIGQSPGERSADEQVAATG
jgi:MoxR-like ATPase